MFKWLSPCGPHDSHTQLIWPPMMTIMNIRMKKRYASVSCHQWQLVHVFTQLKSTVRHSAEDHCTMQCKWCYAILRYSLCFRETRNHIFMVKSVCLSLISLLTSVHGLHEYAQVHASTYFTWLMVDAICTFHKGWIKVVHVGTDISMYFC